MQLTNEWKIGLAFVAGLATAVVAGQFVGRAKAEGLPDRRGAAHDAEAPATGGLSVYIGAHGGLTMVNTGVSQSDSQKSLWPAGTLTSDTSFDGVGGKGMIGGGQVGLDYLFASQSAARPFIGVFASYSWQDTESTLSLSQTFTPIIGSPTTHSWFGSAGLGDSYAIGGRAGFDWGKFKAYGLAAYRHTDLEWSSITDGKADNLSKAGLPGHLTGVDLGVGAGLMLSKNFELAVEAIWTNYKEETIGKDGPKIDADQLQGLVRLNFKY